MEVDIDSELKGLRIALKKLNTELEEVTRQRLVLFEAKWRTEGAIQFLQRLNQHKENTLQAGKSA